MSSALQEIDWRRPWLAPYAAIADLLIAAPDLCCSLNVESMHANLVNHRGLPIRFVVQSDLPSSQAYESFISSTGQVPTRNNLHDFFNALVWLTYPAAKAQLNRIQAEEIIRLSTVETGELSSTSDHHEGNKDAIKAVEGASGTRGKLRDRATIFDENAAVLFTSESVVVEGLRNHEWHDSLYQRRDDFYIGNEIRLFGHALMEKLVKPYKAITAHVWVIPVERQFFQLPEPDKRLEIDRLVERNLRDDLLLSPSMPLPVLGVPGWWPGQDADFYTDINVFRPKKTGRR